jgi:hypothetical protein
MVAMRSSIRSRSTSQYLSDERSRLCVGSSWAVSSSSRIPRGNTLGELLDFRSLCLDLEARNRLRLSRPALINDSPFWIFAVSPLVRVKI